MDTFFRHWTALPTDTTLCALFEQHHVKIEHRAKRLRLFSERCRSDLSSFVITHGDAGGNFITDGEKDYIVIRVHGENAYKSIFPLTIRLFSVTLLLTLSGNFSLRKGMCYMKLSMVLVVST